MSEKPPPVSVLMPVKNAGEYLPPAVNSILSQSHSDFELLLVDDDSTDEALHALPEDRRIRIINNAGHGLVDALNTGLKNAAHNFIARMDSDDTAHPQRLQIQLDYLAANPHVDICAARVELFSDSGLAQGYQLYQAWINGLLHHADIEREFFIESPLPHPTTIYRRDQIQELGGYRNCGWPEDYDLWGRALLAGLKFGKPMGPPLLRWRDYPQRTSRINPSFSKNAFLACKAEILVDYLAEKEINHILIWGCGPTGLRLHDELESRGLKVNGFIDVNIRLDGRTKRNKSITLVSPDQGSIELDLAPDDMILVAVSARGARAQIGQWMKNQGLTEGRSYLFAA